MKKHGVDHEMPKICGAMDEKTGKITDTFCQCNRGSLSEGCTDARTNVDHTLACTHVMREINSVGERWLPH